MGWSESDVPMRRYLAWVPPILLLLAGCSSDPAQPKVTPPPPLVANDTPAHAIERLISAYEKKNESAFAGMFTGDYRYEFSNSTDPSLVTTYSAGWLKTDEAASSSHLFSGYTPSGGATLYSASTISITLAVTTPTDDNSSGADPVTHKILATRVDGQIVVPQPGSDATTYVIENNYNVFYIVRGDSAVGLDSSQPATAQHWYVYRWTDLTGSASPSLAARSATLRHTWGSLKAIYR
jgi:hypothetical protein